MQLCLCITFPAVTIRVLLKSAVQCNSWLPGCKTYLSWLVFERGRVIPHRNIITLRAHHTSFTLWVYFGCGSSSAEGVVILEDDIEKVEVGLWLVSGMALTPSLVVRGSYSFTVVDVSPPTPPHLAPHLLILNTMRHCYSMHLLCTWTAYCREPGKAFSRSSIFKYHTIRSI